MIFAATAPVVCPYDSSYPKMALSDPCPEKSEEAEIFLQGVIDIFTMLEISDARKATATWKPIQAGIIVTTSTPLKLRDLLI